MNWLEHEQQAHSQGYLSVCGVDEAGRGPLAGPVCAAAVILPQGLIIPGVNDSKKLSEKKREALFVEITAAAISYGIAFATSGEIDEINILNATFLAMCRAVEGLSTPADFALIDGNLKPEGLRVPCCAVVHGDAVSHSIAAASILAKVTRDRYMQKLDGLYPQYAFAKHKGYGTRLHYEKLKEHGVSEVHRLSFLKKFRG